MIRRILAIARNTLRAASRSRVALVLLILLVTVALALPRALKGDGTPASEIRMLLTWTLGTAVVLLAIATLWLGCSTTAGEIDDATLTGVKVSPVRSFEICLGKWLGLMTLNTVLLLVVIVLFSVQISLSNFPSDLLQPSRRLLPSADSVAQQAHRVIARAQEEGLIEPDADLNALLQEAATELEREYLAVSPGETFQWQFDWQRRRTRPDARLQIKVGLVSTFGMAGGIDADCSLLDAAGREVIRFPATSDDGRNVVQSLPVAELGEDGVVTVRLAMKDSGEGGAVLVRASDGAELLVPHGSFTGNLLLGGLALLSLLAVLASIGVASGTMFSLPVAIFTASALTLVGMLSQTNLDDYGGCDHHHHATDDTCDKLSSAYAGKALKAVAWTLEPFSTAAPLDNLGDRIHLKPSAVARVVGFTGLVLPLGFNLLGALILRRREFN